MEQGRKLESSRARNVEHLPGQEKMVRVAPSEPQTPSSPELPIATHHRNDNDHLGNVSIIEEHAVTE